MIKYTDLYKLCIIASLVLHPVAKAGNGNANSGGSNGSVTGSSNGNANSGGSNGNANSGGSSGGATSGGTSTGGATSGGSTSGGSSTGGSNGNANSGGSNGGMSGAVNDGSTTGASTGGLNGGNNGDGIGNTGPGNPGNGNDLDVGNAGNTNGNSNSGGGDNGNANSGGSNGNANGNAQGGGDNGNAQGGNDNGNTGGYSGGNNGNGNGNTGPGNQGNDGDNGNACGRNNTCGGTTGSTNGGSETGSTDGGSETGATDGGSTTGELTGTTSGGEDTGSNSGGESTGGEDSGATSGGESTGGETTGGESTGGETGGETSGGETGGETTGGETGGEETGETSGGETTGGSNESKPKQKFKMRLLPLVFGNYDIMKTAVNLTAADERDVRSNTARLDEYRNGFLVTQMRQWDAGLGILPTVYLQNATGLASMAVGTIGLAPTKGRFVQYERFAADEKTADKLNVLPIPSSKKLLDSYKSGESVYFENNGGILFMAGPGIAGAYAGGSVLAEGGFRTLIKKTARGATVEIVKASVRTTSLFTGFTVIKLDGTKVKQLNEGFAFDFDFSRGGNVAVKTYEQLIAGNIKAAQDSAKNAGVTGVTRVADSKTREISKKRNISVGIPMVAMYNWSAGKTYGETASKTYADKTTTDLNYGVYFKEEKGRFFHKHKKLTRAFYSTKATTKNEQNKVVAINEEANFFWNYESDSATTSSYNQALALMQKDLGLAESFSPVMEKKGQKLRFVRLQANVKIPENYVKKLISSAIVGRNAGEMQRETRALVRDYFASGDRLDICKEEEGSTTLEACEKRYLNESLSAVARIQNSLVNLREKKDASAYTYAVALMGKDLVKNQFVMNAFFSQDTACNVKFEVKLEGRRVSRMIKQVPANTSCR